jgi:hypothetical protein
MPPLCAKVKSLIIAECIHKKSFEKLNIFSKEKVCDENNTSYTDSSDNNQMNIF